MPATARDGRLVEGFSMGGYGPAHLGFKRSGLFATVSILSGGPLPREFTETPPGGPRGSYYVFRREFSHVVVREGRFESGNVVVRLAGRSDFPVYPPTPFELKVMLMDGQGRLLETRSRAMDPLPPGAETTVTIPGVPGTSMFRGEIYRQEFPTLVLRNVRATKP